MTRQYDPMMSAAVYIAARKILLADGFEGCGNYWHRNGERYTFKRALAVARLRQMNVHISADIGEFVKRMAKAGRAARRLEAAMYLQLTDNPMSRSHPGVERARAGAKRILEGETV